MLRIVEHNIVSMLEFNDYILVDEIGNYYMVTEHSGQWRGSYSIKDYCPVRSTSTYTFERIQLSLERILSCENPRTDL